MKNRNKKRTLKNRAIVRRLTADDICKGAIEKGHRHCQLGWRESFERINKEDPLTEDEWFGGTVIDDASPSKYDPDAVEGVIFDKLNQSEYCIDDLVDWNDSETTTREEIAATLNAAHRELGYKFVERLPIDPIKKTAF